MENKTTGLDKILKLSIAGGFLIIALSVAYFLVVYLPSKDNTKNQQNRIETLKEETKKEVGIGEEFTLKNGRKLIVKEVKVGNYYQDFGGKIDKSMPMRAQISVRIESDGGPLNESDFNKMYIQKGSQLIKLSNSLGAYWGEYWFEMPKTENFDGMKLSFGQEIMVSLTPYIKANSL